MTRWDDRSLLEDLVANGGRYLTTTIDVEEQAEERFI